MDLFLAACQGLGLALAAGIVTGAIAGVVPERARGLIFVLLLAGAIGGALAFGASLESEDHPAWPGWFVGAAAAVIAFGVARSVVSGAASRAGAGGSPAAIAGTVVLAGLALAALSVLLPPVSLVFLGALAVLALRRRRRADEKYEGLRSLR
jgi:hypothetical protein